MLDDVDSPRSSQIPVSSGMGEATGCASRSSSHNALTHETSQTSPILVSARQMVLHNEATGRLDRAI
eukprot:1689750-Rhodomonas_salina.1